MSEIANRLKAVRSLLLADTATSALVGARVFYPKLPEAEARSMPRAAVVISHRGRGAGPGGGFQQHSRTLVGASCWGATDNEAEQVWRAVEGFFKQLPRTLSGDVYVYSAEPVEGPMLLIDPDTQWPYVFASYSVLASEVVRT